MFNYQHLHSALSGISRRQSDLRTTFINFAKFLEKQLSDSRFTIKGISSKYEASPDRLEISFAGREMQFVFSTTMVENGMRGVVRCYVAVGYPEPKFVEASEFTFNSTGETNQSAPPDNDTLYMDWDGSAINLALHLMHAALQK